MINTPLSEKDSRCNYAFGTHQMIYGDANPQDQFRSPRFGSVHPCPVYQTANPPIVNNQDHMAETVLRTHQKNESYANPQDQFRSPRFESVHPCPVYQTANPPIVNNQDHMAETVLAECARRKV